MTVKVRFVTKMQMNIIILDIIYCFANKEDFKTMTEQTFDENKQK